MSCEQQEINYVGRHFEENEELLNFLLTNKVITQELADSWAEDIEEGERITNLFSPSDVIVPNFPDLQDVNSVCGDGGMFLGYIIKDKLISQTSFDKKVLKAKKQWKKIFNEDAQLNWTMQYF